MREEEKKQRHFFIDKICLFQSDWQTNEPSQSYTRCSLILNSCLLYCFGEMNISHNKPVNAQSILFTTILIYHINYTTYIQYNNCRVATKQCRQFKYLNAQFKSLGRGLQLRGDLNGNFSWLRGVKNTIKSRQIGRDR